MYRMSSQPSKAHLSAVLAVENHAQKNMEEEIKRLVEGKVDLLDSQESKNYENSMIEAI